MLPYY